jgi:hypothetical protein
MAAGFAAPPAKARGRGPQSAISLDLLKHGGREMAIKPNDPPLEQNEDELAPPVAFTVMHSGEPPAQSLESAGAPDVEAALDVESDLEETNGAPAEIDEDGGAAGEERVADTPEAVVRDQALATAFEQNFAATRDRMIAINVKVLQAFLANAETNLDFLAALPSVKSLSELIALQSQFASKQVDALARPAAEIGAMTQDTMARTVDAMRNQVRRPIRN